MHRVTRSTSPATFDVASFDVTSVDGAVDGADGARGNRPPVETEGRWQLARQSSFSDRASLWWDSWVPVATTGWGALVLIAPLFVLTNILGWAAGGRRPGRDPS